MAVDELIGIWVDRRGHAYTRGQGCEGDRGPDGTALWCACYIDFDYEQAWLLEVTRSGEAPCYVAVYEAGGIEVTDLGFGGTGAGRGATARFATWAYDMVNRNR